MHVVWLFRYIHRICRLITAKDYWLISCSYIACRHHFLACSTYQAPCWKLEVIEVACIQSSVKNCAHCNSYNNVYSYNNVDAGFTLFIIISSHFLNQLNLLLLER